MEKDMEKIIAALEESLKTAKEGSERNEKWREIKAFYDGEINALEYALRVIRIFF